ncbi:hypothetical protein D9Q98_005330 [Chlorella vulgaris]|uniref:Right handed beta helix domain-containing protein n=1 Tax=Chlorella vulgaris TaxID=3077 RepID=A0A9D4YVT9_CHLVU|nr:hypothetical protein D9Q98_005330 [Chlorella vulgaris]
MATLGQRAGTGALIFASLLLTVSTAAADSLAELPSDTATIHSGRRALTAGAVEAAAGNTAQAAATFPLPTGRPYNIGRPAGLRHIWVDPRAGSDSRAGTGRATALRTLAAAWRRIPVSMRLTAGYHIHIIRGSLPTTALPNYWENRWGSKAAPIIIEAADGAGTVTLKAPVNVFNVSHLHLIGLTIRSAFDPFHCERCTNLLLRNVISEGICTSWTDCGVQEAIKINQCRGVWIEGVVAGWANDNAFDCVSCQYGHIIDSRFHHSEWGVYLKGGSAYFLVANNLITDHGSSGFAAGQGTGFEFMDRPWMQYEAYDIKLVNNVIRNIEGAGFGVWGCYDCFYAHNTLISTGNRSHLVDIKFGEHSCDGDAAGCTANYNAGGWGPRSVGSVVSVPNRNWQQLQVDDPRQSGISRLGTVKADNNLVLRGNVFYNGGADKPLGVGAGCPPTNPTCNPTQLLAQNVFNKWRPDVSVSTFRPASATGRLATYSGLWRPLRNFGAWSPGNAVPAGNLTNLVRLDRAGLARTASRNAPGAYVPPLRAVG